MPWNQERSKATRFKKNPEYADRSFIKNGTTHIKGGCRVCKGDISLPSFKRGGRCRNCWHAAKRAEAELALRLRDEARLPYKRIAERMGIKYSKVTLLLRRLKYGREAATNKNFYAAYLPKKCELCGYSRFVEMAHIIFKKHGGKNDLNNYLALCPNCHYLADNEKLTLDEEIKMSSLIRARKKQVFIDPKVVQSAMD